MSQFSIIFTLAQILYIFTCTLSPYCKLYSFNRLEYPNFHGWQNEKWIIFKQQNSSLGILRSTYQVHYPRHGSLILIHVLMKSTIINLMTFHINIFYFNQIVLPYFVLSLFNNRNLDEIREYLNPCLLHFLNFLLSHTSLLRHGLHTKPSKSFFFIIESLKFFFTIRY